MKSELAYSNVEKKTMMGLSTEELKEFVGMEVEKYNEYHMLSCKIRMQVRCDISEKMHQYR